MPQGVAKNFKNKHNIVYKHNNYTSIKDKKENEKKLFFKKDGILAHNFSEFRTMEMESCLYMY